MAAEPNGFESNTQAQVAAPELLAFVNVTTFPIIRVSAGVAKPLILMLLVAIVHHYITLIMRSEASIFEYSLGSIKISDNLNR